MSARGIEESAGGYWLPTLTETANFLSPSMQKWPNHRRLKALTGGRRDSAFWIPFWKWMMGFPSDYPASIGQLGNAVVPQQAAHAIGRMLWT